jgi:hypothetical protein
MLNSIDQDTAMVTDVEQEAANLASLRDANQLEDALAQMFHDPARHSELAEVLLHTIRLSCSETDVPVALAQVSLLSSVLTTPGNIDVARLYQSLSGLLSPVEQFLFSRKVTSLCK